MNASLDLEFARMHDEKEESEDPANTTVIENNEVAISSASIAKNHPASLIINGKRVAKKTLIKILLFSCNC